MRTGTDTVLDFITQFDLSRSDAAVVRQARRCLLDGLGALLAGCQTPLAALSARLAVAHLPETPKERCTLLAGGTASLLGAAFANGFASNALDVEHGYRPTQGRPGACLLPVLLALAETAPSPVSGASLLEALVVGYEVAIRAGLLRNTDDHNVFTSGAWASLGAAAAGGRLLRLPRAVLRQALGATDYHSPLGLILRGVQTPCMAKDGVGWGAFTAMSSLLLAREGFTAPEPLFSEAADPDMNGLGRDFHFLHLYFKPFCCCRWTHAAVAGALALARKYDLAPGDIDRIRVYTFSHAAALSRDHPGDTEQAQYNLTYPVAVALADGCVSGVQVLPPRLAAPEVLALQDKVEVEVREDFEREFPARTLAEVILEARGRAYASGPLEPPWEAEDSPSDAELHEKFLRLTTPLCGEAEAQRLAGCAWRAESLEDARQLLPRSRP